MTFLSRPVLDIGINFDSPEETADDDFDFNLKGGLIGTPWKPTTTTRRIITLPYQFGTAAEWREFRDFVTARKGQQQGFWLPVWTTHYYAESITPTSTTLTIRSVGLEDVFEAGNQYGYLAIVNSAGVECHSIASVTVDGDNEVIELNEAIGDVTINSIAICPLIFCRFEGDDIEYRFITDGIVETSVKFAELPQEYSETPAIDSTAFFYEITRGAETFRFTSWSDYVTDDEDSVWTPGNLQHNEITQSIDGLPNSLEIQCATDDPDHPLRYFISRSGTELMYLTVFSFDALDPEIDRDAPIYTGRIQDVKFATRGSVTADISSIMRVGERQVPSKLSQRTCNHDFCDVNCGVSAAAKTTTGTLSSITDEYVSSAQWGIKATVEDDPNWFALGIVTIGTESRHVVGQDGNNLYIDEPFYRATLSMSASARAGCDKRIRTCDGKHDNLARFGGFQYIPNSNPQYKALETPKESGGKKS